MKKHTKDGQNQNLLIIMEDLIQTLDSIRPYIQDSEECFMTMSLLSMTLYSVQIGLKTNVPINVIQNYLINTINNAKGMRREFYKLRKTKKSNFSEIQIKFLWQVSYFGGTLKNLDYSTKNVFPYIKTMNDKLKKYLNKK